MKEIRFVSVALVTLAALVGCAAPAEEAEPAPEVSTSGVQPTQQPREDTGKATCIATGVAECMNDMAECMDSVRWVWSRDGDKNCTDAADMCILTVQANC
jgi:hypothetical protein